MEIELIRNTENSFSYILYESGSNVGRIHVSLTGNVAKIEDIIVDEIEYSPWWFLPFIKWTKSFRGKGYGTALLTQAIQHCRSLESSEIIGEMHGDEQKLTVWYQRFGFIVSEDKSISLSL
ncbi:GNAT family N-acetyltransferase [Vibrio vulnificus]|nr:GNAT family N-acetyltransferase [Vibrio vulnificus]